MNSKLIRNATIVLLTCAAVAAIGRSEPKASYLDPNISTVQRLIRMMHDRNLNTTATEDQIAGYYEGLLAGKPVNLLGKSQQSEQFRFRGDYLYYETKPNIDVEDYNNAPELRHVTNSHGMPDGEYPVEPRPGTRRLALLGDSIIRGKGAPFGENFEALFERDLNTTHKEGTTYELLNFSANGYRLTQLVDVALEKVPAFKPDVYVICLTQLSVNRKWGDHVAQLVWDRIDLKYPFLRELKTTAGLDERDAPGTMDAKLAQHRLEAFRWAMATIRDKARQEQAAVLAILVPAANRPERQQALFEGPQEILRELGIPTIDLLDTFAGVDDPFQFAVGDENGDIHPNRAGHRLIFEALRRKVDADPELTAIVLGSQQHANGPKR